MPGFLKNLVRFLSLDGDSNATSTSENVGGLPDLQAPHYTYQDDASWAVANPRVSDVLGGHISSLYTSYIEDCTNAASTSKTPFSCEDEEIFRLDMNTYQPQSVYNYTKLGYQKIKAPAKLYKLIRDFYDKNKDKDEVEWKSVNTYHNMWEVPPTILHINQDRFEGGGPALQSEIWSTAKELMEEWSGQKLSPVSLYGIRKYHNGSILAPHVDRFPLVTSAIINIDQDVDEPWPLEVYGHDGKATNVTMEPGDMVLYESHSVIHGRPFPLNGKFYANVFVHFEPVGPLDPNEPSTYDPALDLPPYLIAGTKWEATWRHKNPNGWKGKSKDARKAASNADLEMVKNIAKSDPSSFQTPDDLGWTPFHESVRAGNVDCVETILYAVGADQIKNTMTYTGYSPLGLARQYLSEDHEVTQLLIKLGAEDKRPVQEPVINVKTGGEL